MQEFINYTSVCIGWFFAPHLPIQSGNNILVLEPKYHLAAFSYAPSDGLKCLAAIKDNVARCQSYVPGAY